MAAKRKTKSAKKADAAIDKIAVDFAAQPAQLLDTERFEIEARFESTEDRVTRRLALAMLTKSAADLIATVQANRGVAVNCTQVADTFRGYADRLRSLAEMMDSAGVRLHLAVCFREDMVSVLEEAKASARVEVGHG